MKKSIATCMFVGCVAMGAYAHLITSNTDEYLAKSKVDDILTDGESSKIYFKSSISNEFFC